jgi:hypothetical protein
MLGNPTYSSIKYKTGPVPGFHLITCLHSSKVYATSERGPFLILTLNSDLKTVPVSPLRGACQLC